MKDDFSTKVEVKNYVAETVLNALRQRSPYITFQIYPTGLDKDDQILRISANIVAYNKDNKRYEATSTFDKVLKLSEEAKANLINNANVDNICAMAGVDKDDYLNQKIGEDIQDFRFSLMFFLKAHENTSAFMVVNGYDSIMKTFGSSFKTATEVFSEMKDKLVVFDNTRLLSEIYPSPTMRTLEDIAQDFGKTATTYQEKEKVLQDVVSFFGMQEGVLDKSGDLIADSNLRYEALVEKGKIQYQNDSVDKKLDLLLTRKTLTPSAPYVKGSFKFPPIHTPQTDKLDEAIREKKGIVVYQCTSTGFKFGDCPTGVSLITACYNEETGKYEVAKKEGRKYFRHFLIDADAKSVLGAHTDAVNGGYDCFKEGNINYEDYIRGIGAKGEKVYSQTEAATSIADYFANLPVKDYLLVSNGSLRANPSISYSGGCLKQIANLPELTAPFMDGTQFLKEYAYEKYLGKKDYGTEILNYDTWQEESFALESFAHHYSSAYQNLYGSLNKASFTLRLLNTYANEVLEKEQALTSVTTKEEEQTTIPVSIEETTTEPIKEEKEDLADSHFISFYDEENDRLSEFENENKDEDSYETEEPEEDEDYEDYIHRSRREDIRRRAKFDEDFDFRKEPSRHENKDSYEEKEDNFLKAFLNTKNNHSSHGNLYSDKHGDSMPVVSATNVSQIGEKALPHVSEAKTESTEMTEVLIALREQNKFLTETMAIQNQMMQILLQSMKEQQEQITLFCSKKKNSRTAIPKATSDN